MEPSLLANVQTASDMDDPDTVSGSLPVNCSTGGMRLLSRHERLLRSAAPWPEARDHHMASNGTAGTVRNALVGLLGIDRGG